MGKYVDFHIHSTHSDGILKPKQIINYMLSCNISCFSITDHNNISAYEEELDLKGIELVPGVEIDVENKDDLQFLCYSFDVFSKEINHALEKIQKGRRNICAKLIMRLHRMGLNLQGNDTFFENINDFDYICRMLADYGFGTSIEDVKEKYFRPGGNLYFKTPVMQIEECIQLFHESGGKIILAHPGRVTKDRQKLQRIIRECVEYGIDGIECYHPDHDSELSEELVETAKKYGLIITGGSDLHEESTSYRVKRADVTLI